MLTLKDIQEAAALLAEIDEPVGEVHVSPRIAEILKNRPSAIMPSPLFGVPIIVDQNYQPGWWSEHYRDRIVMHTEKGKITIPNMPTKIKPLGHEKFEIVMPPVQRKDVTHG